MKTKHKLVSTTNANFFCHLNSDVMTSMSLDEATSARLKSPQPIIGENTSVTSLAIGIEAVSDFNFAFPGLAFFSKDLMSSCCFGDAGVFEMQPDFVICSFLLG